MSMETDFGQLDGPDLLHSQIHPWRRSSPHFGRQRLLVHEWNFQVGRKEGQRRQASATPFELVQRLPLASAQTTPARGAAKLCA